MRTIISIIATLVAILIYVSGYVSGSHGWWWTMIALIAFYAAVYKLTDL